MKTRALLGAWNRVEDARCHDGIMRSCQNWSSGALLFGLFFYVSFSFKRCPFGMSDEWDLFAFLLASGVDSSTTSAVLHYIAKHRVLFSYVIAACACWVRTAVLSKGFVVRFGTACHTFVQRSSVVFVIFACGTFVFVLSAGRARCFSLRCSRTGRKYSCKAPSCSENSRGIHTVSVVHLRYVFDRGPSSVQNNIAEVP